MVAKWGMEVLKMHSSIAEVIRSVNTDTLQFSPRWEMAFQFQRREIMLRSMYTWVKYGMKDYCLVLYKL